MNRDQKGRKITEVLKKLSAANTSLNFNEFRVIVALERAIARLENDPILAKHLIFKGGFVMLKTVETNRFTRDLDALAFEISQKEVPDLIIHALETDLDDGVWFGDIKIKTLEGKEEAKTLRFDFVFQIGDPPKEAEKLKKLSRIHVDIGFGDELDGRPQKQEMKSILPQDKSIFWLIYPIEFIFSEKLQTLLFRGSANSRAKDIYDLTILFSKCGKQKLLEAIQTTFKSRNTPLPKSFFSEVNSFNLATLQSAWRTVQISDKQSFEECWDNLLRLLKELDGLL